MVDIEIYLNLKFSFWQLMPQTCVQNCLMQESIKFYYSSNLLNTSYLFINPQSICLLIIIKLKKYFCNFKLFIIYITFFNILICNQQHYNKTFNMFLILTDIVGVMTAIVSVIKIRDLQP